jgi:hypothetical protein
VRERNAYVFRVLELVHTGLRRRGLVDLVFNPDSDRRPGSSVLHIPPLRSTSCE